MEGEKKIIIKSAEMIFSVLRAVLNSSQLREALEPNSESVQSWKHLCHLKFLASDQCPAQSLKGSFPIGVQIAFIKSGQRGTIALLPITLGPIPVQQS